MSKEISEQEVRNNTEDHIRKRHKEVRLWANPTGNGVVGNAREAGKGKYMVDGRRVKFGGPDGASDFLGIQQIKITENMVGKKIGIFVAIETKKPKWRLPTINQKKAWTTFIQQTRFIKMVRALGGHGGYVRNNEDLEDVLSNEGKEQEELLRQVELHIRKQMNNG